MNPLDFAMQAIRNNPNIANNPNAQSMLNVLQNGSNEEREQLANNLCQSYGVTPEQAIQQAKSFFKIQ